MSSRRLLALMCLSLCLPSIAQAKLYNAQTATLDNGLKIVVVPIHRTPALTHMIWYRAGSADEPEGVSGTAHYLEHLLFKASTAAKSGEFSETVRRVGGNDNAFTSWDMTTYHQTVPSDALPDMMRMEAARMTGIMPTLPEIETERNVVIEERRQVIESSPGAILSEKMRNALFGNHPYGRPIIGWKDEMENLKWVDALAYYRTHYAPENAVVVISGDTTLEQVLPIAQATYGQIPRKSVTQRNRPASPAPTQNIHTEYKSPSVRQPVWQYMLRVPSARQNKAASLSLSVLADLLSGATGKLYQDLTVAKKLATTINAGYSGYAWDDDTFVIYAAPAQGVDMKTLETEIFKTLSSMANTGFSEDEVKASIRRMQDAAEYELDSLTGPANSIGYALISGLTLDDIENWSDDIATVTTADVNDAFKTYLQNNHGVIGYLLPENGGQ